MFENLTKKIVANFVFKVTENKKLFKVDISGDDLWNIYLSSFDRDTVFRDPESSTHNCNTCKNFILQFSL
jgi:hypothetical protein